MKVVHGMRPEDQEAPIPEVQDFKTCPICGATCFSDMEVCFGCLHHFEGDGSFVVDQIPSNTHEGQKMLSTKSKIEAESDSCSSETCTISTPGEPHETERASDISPIPLDHLRDIPGLRKPETLRPCSSHAHCKNTHDAMTSHHICSDGDGRQFEISISVKLL